MADVIFSISAALVSALSERESSALWELNWVHVTGTAPKMPVVLAYVPAAGDWTLVFHGRSKGAPGKAAAPHNLQASQTHLLKCALQALVHHLLPSAQCRARWGAVHSSVHSISALGGCLGQSLNGSSSDNPNPFQGCCSQTLERLSLCWPLDKASLKPIYCTSDWDSSIIVQDQHWCPYATAYVNAQ